MTDLQKLGFAVSADDVALKAAADAYVSASHDADGDIYAVYVKAVAAKAEAKAALAAEKFYHWASEEGQTFKSQI